MKLTRRSLVIGAPIVAAAASGCDVLGPLWKRSPLGFALEPFSAPNATEPDLVTHVLGRMTFGIAPGDRDRVLGLARSPASALEAWFERQLRPDSIDDPIQRWVVGRFWAEGSRAGDAFELKEGVVSQEMVRAALLRAVYSERQLEEVMVHFWYDHFNVAIGKGDCQWLAPAYERDAIREHALGSFRRILSAVTLSPAMLWYLDGRLNKRERPSDKPNENHARELLELHTLGIDGGYDHHDITEVARALSGWRVRDKSQFKKGSVEFVASAHDGGPKQVLGYSIAAGGGETDVERVLDILANHPSTAHFLARKLCARFIADPPPAEAVAAIAAAYRSNGGQMRALLRALFHRPEFLLATTDARYRGNLLKRPFHLMASLLRATGATTDAGAELLLLLQRMGHVPFHFPTPDGYPIDAEFWRDGLLWRWHLADKLGAGAIAGTRIDAERLLRAAGSRDALLRHLLGRRASPDERSAIEAAGSRALGMALALPAIQRF